MPKTNGGLGVSKSDCKHGPTKAGYAREFCPTCPDGLAATRRCLQWCGTRWRRARVAPVTRPATRTGSSRSPATRRRPGTARLASARAPLFRSTAGRWHCSDASAAASTSTPLWSTATRCAKSTPRRASILTRYVRANQKFPLSHAFSPDGARGELQAPACKRRGAECEEEDGAQRLHALLPGQRPKVARLYSQQNDGSLLQGPLFTRTFHLMDQIFDDSTTILVFTYINCYSPSDLGIKCHFLLSLIQKYIWL